MPSWKTTKNLRIKDGQASFPFPDTLKQNLLSSSIKIHYLYITQCRKDVLYLVTSDSSKSGSLNKDLARNVITFFSTRSDEFPREFNTYGEIECPLTSTPETLTIDIGRTNSTLAKDVEGYMVIEIRGEIENELLIL